MPSPVTTSPPADAQQVARALEKTVVCDLSALAVLSIDGADAAAFLQGQLSNDVRRAGAGTWQATTYNSPKGRILANLLLWPHGDGYRALLPADLAESIRKRLAMFVLRSKVTIGDASPVLARLGIAGAQAAGRVETAFGQAPTPGTSHGSAAGEVLGLAADRFIAVVPAADADRVATLLGATDGLAPYEAWLWRAIRAGEPLVTAATQDQFVLQTANLDVLGAVSFDKGCYTGQEIVARTQYLGRLKERLFGYHLAQGPAVPGAKLYSPAFGDQACGTIVNAAPAPDGGVDLLAVVQTAAADDVRLGSLDGRLLEPFPLPYDVPAPSAPRRPG